MVLRERVADHVYVFRSGIYAQVNAGLVATEEGCVVIDTLPFPQETQAIVDFVHNRLRSQVRYLILTHSHADHVYGAYMFPEAEVVGHLLSRDYLIKQTRPALIKARQRNAALAEVYLRMPTLLTEKESSIRIGGFTLAIRHSPGHSPDLINVYVREEKVLFSSDTVMPVPYIVYGDIDDERRSLYEIIETSPVEDVVPGHGEVLLRGEVKSVMRAHLAYLDQIQEHAEGVLASGGGRAELDALDVEACGVSPIALNGLVQQLHQANIYSLYGKAKKRAEKEKAAA